MDEKNLPTPVAESLSMSTDPGENYLFVKGFIPLRDGLPQYRRREEQEEHRTVTQILRYSGEYEARIIFQTYEYDLRKIKIMVSMDEELGGNSQDDWSRTQRVPLKQAIELYDALEEARVWHGTLPETNGEHAR